MFLQKSGYAIALICRLSLCLCNFEENLQVYSLKDLCDAIYEPVWGRRITSLSWQQKCLLLAIFCLLVTDLLRTTERHGHAYFQYNTIEKGVLCPFLPHSLIISSSNYSVLWKHFLPVTEFNIVPLTIHIVNTSPFWQFIVSALWLCGTNMPDSIFVQC